MEKKAKQSEKREIERSLRVARVNSRSWVITKKYATGEEKPAVDAKLQAAITEVKELQTKLIVHKVHAKKLAKDLKKKRRRSQS